MAILEPNTWAKLEGDHRFCNWAKSIPRSSAISIPENGLRAIEGTEFMRHPEEYIPEEGDTIVYHEEYGSRAHHSATINVGLCDKNGNIWYFETALIFKKWLYRNELINRGEYNGTGDHVAAIRMIIGLRRICMQSENWKAWAEDEENPFATLIKSWIEEEVTTKQEALPEAIPEILAVPLDEESSDSLSEAA